MSSSSLRFQQAALLNNGGVSFLLERKYTLAVKHFSRAIQILQKNFATTASNLYGGSDTTTTANIIGSPSTANSDLHIIATPTTRDEMKYHHDQMMVCRGVYCQAIRLFVCSKRGGGGRGVENDATGAGENHQDNIHCEIKLCVASIIFNSALAHHFLLEGEEAASSSPSRTQSASSVSLHRTRSEKLYGMVLSFLKEYDQYNEEDENAILHGTVNNDNNNNAVYHQQMAFIIKLGCINNLFQMQYYDSSSPSTSSTTHCGDGVGVDRLARETLKQILLIVHHQQEKRTTTTTASQEQPRLLCFFEQPQIQELIMNILFLARSSNDTTIIVAAAA